MSILCATNLAVAYDFTIQDIEIDGLKRVSPGKVLDHLPIKIGDRINDKDERIIIRSLFESKLFYDAYVRYRNDILLITVHENPVVSNIKFIGNKDVDDKELIKLLLHYGIAKEKTFLSSTFEHAKQEIRYQYLRQGKLGCIIESDINFSAKDNSVAIRITVLEGIELKINRINIVGNSLFRKSKLLGLLKSTHSTRGLALRLLPINSGVSNNYSKDRLSKDLKKLKLFMLILSLNQLKLLFRVILEKFSLQLILSKVNSIR